MQQPQPALRTELDCPIPTPATPPSIPENSPGFPIPAKIADQTAQLHAPAYDPSALSPKQHAALNRLFAGDDERFICQTLKIDRKTLYNWKRHHPAFRAELARRNTEVWTDLLGDLRAAVTDAVGPPPRRERRHRSRIRRRPRSPPQIRLGQDHPRAHPRLDPLARYSGRGPG